MCTNRVEFYEYDRGAHDVAVITHVFDEDGPLVDEFELEHSYVPNDGKFIGAQFELSVSTDDELNDLSPHVGSASSKIPLVADVVRSARVSYAVVLRDPENNEKRGMTRLSQEWLEDDQITEGTEIDLVISMEYDHEMTKEALGYSGEEIETKREETKSGIESLSER